MSRESLPSIVATITSRLRELLTKARSVKATTTIEPTLSSSDFLADIRNIAFPPDADLSSTAISTSPSPTYQTALETAAREILYEKLGACDVNEAEFVDVWNLLDLLQLCADQRQCDAGLALWLVEEMVDSQTIDGCRYILEYLKSRRTQLIGSELTRNKSNTILRTCNELLRRLSRAEDAVFCGDVFVFLFQVFPLGDKSAVNLRGEFHVDNVTTFDPEPEISNEATDGEGQTEGAMQVDTEPQAEDKTTNGDVSNDAQAKTEPSETVDKSQRQGTPSVKVTDSSKDSKRDTKPKEEVPDSRTLYPTFWSLQHVFSNPTRSFDTEALSGFKKGLELTFTKFKAAPKVPRVAGQSRKRKRGENDSDFASTFNPKYLTSRDLFDLELSDLTFQRHILVQALILLDFLLSLTPEGKKRTESLKTQKSMIYNYTLSDEDSKWCRDMRRTISQYLKDSSPDGSLYHRMVDNVLSRDKNWVAWKIESCQDISRPPVSFDNWSKAQESARKMCAPRRVKAQVMGSLNLDFLDENNPNFGLEKLRERARMMRPKTEDMVREVQNIDLDLEMVDKENQPEEWAELTNKRASKTWRTMRLERANRLSLFAKIDESKNFEKLVEPDEPPPAQQEEAKEEQAVVANGEGTDLPQVDGAMETEETGEQASAADAPPVTEVTNGVDEATEPDIQDATEDAAPPQAASEPAKDGITEEPGQTVQESSTEVVEDAAAPAEAPSEATATPADQ